MDPDIDADIPALIGASAALSLAGVPFAGPIGAARVGYKDGKYLLNPTQKDLKDPVAPGGRRHGEVGAHGRIRGQGLSEEAMLGAAVSATSRCRSPSRPSTTWSPRGQAEVEWAPGCERRTRRRRRCELQGRVVRGRPDDRKAVALLKVAEIKAARTLALAGGEAPIHRRRRRHFALQPRSNIVRQRILNGEPRIDGRNATTVRPITVKVGVLPRTHGSALFTRGETQALVATTSALAVTRRSSTRSKANAASLSCSTTTSLRSRSVRPA